MALKDALAGRVALVTGGAGGIGEALARALGAAGARVVVADIDGAAAERAASAMRAGGSKVVACTLDVRDGEAFAKTVASIEETLGPLELLVNNAGIAMGGDVRALSLDDWRRVIDVNLYGVVNGVRAAYPRMAARRSGHIVNIASVSGLAPYALVLPYTTSKHAVVGLSLALRAEAEAARVGVRVSVACPGMVETPIWTSSTVRGADPARLAAARPRGITADACAAAILAGIARNRPIITVTAEARAMWWLQRIAPRLGVRLHARIAKTVRARAGIDEGEGELRLSTR